MITLGYIRHKLMTNTVNAELDNTKDGFWTYISTILINGNYEVFEFVVPENMVDDGFSSVMPAKYLLNFLRIR